MSTYVLLEINCDHLDRIDDEAEVTIGSILASVCRQPHDAAKKLGYHDLQQAVRIVGQTGERTYADDIKQNWLWKPDTLLRDTLRSAKLAPTTIACGNDPKDASACPNRFPQTLPDLSKYVADLLVYYDIDQLTFIGLSQNAKLALADAYDRSCDELREDAMKITIVCSRQFVMVFLFTFDLWVWAHLVYRVVT